MMFNANYVPSETEEYMSPMQLEYFKSILLKMKNDLLKSSGPASSLVSQSSGYDADMSDNASVDAESYTSSRTRDLQKNTLMSIENSLSSIKNGDYGYCKISGKKIGLRRLMANPTATLCIEEQERYEKIKKSYINDNDDDYII